MLWLQSILFDMVMWVLVLLLLVIALAMSDST